MPRTRRSVWDFDPDRQDLGFMVGYAARDLWSCIREEQRGALGSDHDIVLCRNELC